jgi:transcriptional regulator with XRE-family HTH domain
VSDRVIAFGDGLKPYGINNFDNTNGHERPFRLPFRKIGVNKHYRCINREKPGNALSGWRRYMAKNDGKQVEFWRKRAQKITTAMLNKAWTQAKLAEKAGHDVRTIRELVHGKAVSNQVVVNVCQALSIEAELSDPDEVEIEVSESWYGSYAREPCRNYEGAFFAVRRSFTYPDQFVRSIFEIRWHSEDWIFVFEEHQAYLSEHNHKVDHSQKGEMYISQFTGLIHLVTVSLGAVRTITLTKMRGSIMRGAVLTQADRNVFFPAVRLRDLPSQNYRLCRRNAYEKNRPIEARR